MTMRLIDADQMLADEKEAYYAAQSKIDDITLWRANYIVHHKIKKLIADTPTIDAVPVVRCKDCKWYVKYREIPPFCDNPICGMQHPNDETFCSYGERRDDD